MAIRVTFLAGGMQHRLRCANGFVLHACAREHLFAILLAFWCASLRICFLRESKHQ
jgi:hypothetical protein